MALVRRICVWIGAAGCLLLVAAAAASLRWAVAVDLGSGRALWVVGGRVLFQDPYPWVFGDGLTDSRAFVTAQKSELSWRWDWSPRAPTAAVIPLWAPLVLLAGPTAVLWWRDRRPDARHQPNHCIRCAYDLSGTTGPHCPECGAPKPQRRPA